MHISTLVTKMHYIVRCWAFQRVISKRSTCKIRRRAAEDEPLKVRRWFNSFIHSPPNLQKESTFSSGKLNQCQRLKCANRQISSRCERCTIPAGTFEKRRTRGPTSHGARALHRASRLPRGLEAKTARCKTRLSGRQGLRQEQKRSLTRA